MLGGINNTIQRKKKGVRRPGVMDKCQHASKFLTTCHTRALTRSFGIGKHLKIYMQISSCTVVGFSFAYFMRANSYIFLCKKLLLFSSLLCLPHSCKDALCDLQGWDCLSVAERLTYWAP